MFQREIDWHNAVNVICDLMRGTSTLSVETHRSAAVGDKRQSEISSWRYEQTQAFQATEGKSPRLFTLAQLREMLVDMSKVDIFHAYECNPAVLRGSETAKSLAEFSAIAVSLVTLTVGDVTMSWALVSLGEPRDLILWKMRYHLRDATLGPQMSQA